jgi:hypothetical protein
MSRRSVRLPALLPFLLAAVGPLGCSDRMDGAAGPEVQVRLTPEVGGPTLLLQLSEDTPEGTIEISNRGTAALVLGQTLLAERTSEGEFALRILQDSCAARSLDPGRSCTIVLRSNNRECEQAALQIGTNDPLTPLVRVSIRYFTGLCVGGT